jgi:hypothetical protein
MKAVAGREADDGGPFAWIGIALVALGTVFSVSAGVEYMRVRRAILSGRRISTGGFLPPLVTLLVAVIGLAMVGLLVARSL